jgi:hypothetical protein
MAGAVERLRTQQQQAQEAMAVEVRETQQLLAVRELLIREVVVVVRQR